MKSKLRIQPSNGKAGDKPQGASSALLRQGYSFAFEAVSLDMMGRFELAGALKRHAERAIFSDSYKVAAGLTPEERFIVTST